MSEDYAGQTVSVWLFSEPRQLGTYTVSENGTIRVEIPEDVELGEHQLAAYNEAGDLIGWQAVTVVAPGGIGGIGAPGASVPGLGGALPNAGAPATLWLMIPLGLSFGWPEPPRCGRVDAPPPDPRRGSLTAAPALGGCSRGPVRDRVRRR